MTVLDAVFNFFYFKGARGNTSLKKLTIWLYSNQEHLKAAAAELQQVRPQLELRAI